MPTTDDVTLAQDLAVEVGAALVALKDRWTDADGDARALGDAGDAMAHARIVELLRAQRPGDAVLSEEGLDDLERLQAERVWIVDPLDGTREYPVAGRIDWAVHIALWERSAIGSKAAPSGLTAAAFSLPALDDVYTTVPGPAWVDGDAAAATDEQTPRLVTSASRPPEFVPGVLQRTGWTHITAGSVGAKVGMILRGKADAYAHDGALNEWDAAAPLAVALAHGLVVVGLRGQTLDFNKQVPVTGGLIVARPGVAAVLIEALEGLVR
jgi:3'(2'), 5'-bisphosphate nucleotidase